MASLTGRQAPQVGGSSRSFGPRRSVRGRRSCYRSCGAGFTSWSSAPFADLFRTGPISAEHLRRPSAQNSTTKTRCPIQVPRHPARQRGPSASLCRTCVRLIKSAGRLTSWSRCRRLSPRSSYGKCRLTAARPRRRFISTLRKRLQTLVIPLHSTSIPHPRRCTLVKLTCELGLPFLDGASRRVTIHANSLPRYLIAPAGDWSSPKMCSRRHQNRRVRRKPSPSPS